MNRRLAVSGPRGPVEVDLLVDAPAAPVGRLLLLHGFARKAPALDELAARAAQAGLHVLRPSLSSFRPGTRLVDGAVVAAVAESAAAVDPEAGPLVVAGHSIGGAAAAHAAAHLVTCGVEVTGLVLIDPNDPDKSLVEPALEHLEQVPLRAIIAATGGCNRQGRVMGKLVARRSGYLGVQLTTGTHCDVEGHRADLVCRKLCGAITPDNADLVQTLAVQWSHSFATGDPVPQIEPGGDRLAELVAADRVREVVGRR